MKIKTFEISLVPGQRERDEEAVNAFMSSVEILDLETALLPARNAWAAALFYEQTGTPAKPAPKKSDKIAFEPDCELTDQERERYDALRLWRNERARDLGYDAYMVAANSALLTVAKCAVECPDDLLKIKGFGPRKVELYGEEIVALLNSV